MLVGGYVGMAWLCGIQLEHPDYTDQSGIGALPNLCVFLFTGVNAIARCVSRTWYRDDARLSWKRVCRDNVCSCIHFFVGYVSMCCIATLGAELLLFEHNNFFLATHGNTNYTISGHTSAYFTIIL